VELVFKQVKPLSIRLKNQFSFEKTDDTDPGSNALWPLIIFLVSSSLLRLQERNSGQAVMNRSKQALAPMIDR
jgi:hypothetical protein